MTHPRRIIVTLGIAAGAILAPALAFADVGGQITPVGSPQLQAIDGQCELVSGSTVTPEPFGAPVVLTATQTAVCLHTPAGDAYVTGYVPPASPTTTVAPTTAPVSDPVPTPTTTTVPSGKCTS